jgi:hypothetical protein
MQLAVEQQKNTTDNTPKEEVPHFVYCVFFAALTLWCAQACSVSSPDVENLNHEESQTAGQVSHAIEILSSSPVMVTKKLLVILRSLPSPSSYRESRIIDK